jgi:hypothetical protein
MGEAGAAEAGAAGRQGPGEPIHATTDRTYTDSEIPRAAVCPHFSPQ